MTSKFSVGDDVTICSTDFSKRLYGKYGLVLQTAEQSPSGLFYLVSIPFMKNPPALLLYEHELERWNDPTSV